MAVDRAGVRDLLLVTLAVTTGATDATAFVALGHVFASVITGNLALLGISAARTDGSMALSAGCALGGYAVGVLLCAPARAEDGHEGELWPAAVTVTLAVDLALLCGFAVGWLVAGADPGAELRAVLLGVVSAAMGVQSVAVRRLGQLSTTYLTSTLTGLLESVRSRRWTAAETRGGAILVAAAAGAAAATLLIEVLDAAGWVVAVQLVPVAAVICVAAAGRIGQ